MTDSTITNAMTIDVEDYFQVSAFEASVEREDWSGFQARVERNTDRLLQIMAGTQTKATFFVLGWVAERFPALIRRIVEQGHELASHGYDHVRVTDLDARAFREDVAKTKAILEDIGACAVRGYRAPTFSIGPKTVWALGVLREVGYRYSSSIYPVRHDLYGFPEAPRFAFTDQVSGMLEIPITTVRLMNRNLPCGGGGYFRLYPYCLTRLLLRRVNRVDVRPCVFYTHPWEIDPEQPRQEGLSFKTRFRHYLNLHRMAARLERLLRDFRWDRMDRVFLESTPAPTHLLRQA